MLLDIRQTFGEQDDDDDASVAAEFKTQNNWSQDVWTYKDNNVFFSFFLRHINVKQIFHFSFFFFF